MLTKYMLAWLGLMLIGILNGILRVGTYGQVIAELTAHQLSTLTGVFFMGIYVCWLSRRWPLPSVGMAWLVGFIWLGMTICFEFLFGHYIMGHPWDRLLEDYNIFAGRIWIVVLFWITIAPRIFYGISLKKQAL